MSKDNLLEENVAKLIAVFPPPWSHPSYRFGYLSNREIQVLYLVAHGKTNKEIGDDLFISITTVAEHMKRIHSKSDVRGRSRLAVTAYKILTGGYEREAKLMQGEKKK